MLLVRQSIVAGVNSILGTYCKGAVGKKGDKILAGCTFIASLNHTRTRRFYADSISGCLQFPQIASRKKEDINKLLQVLRGIYKILSINSCRKISREVHFLNSLFVSWDLTGPV